MALPTTLLTFPLVIDQVLDKLDKKLSKEKHYHKASVWFTN